jgi:hypothetical protein
MGKFPGADMDREQRDLWNARVPSVTVKDFCPECETLKPDVKKRQNYWPSITCHCFSDCFSRMLAEFEGLVVC